MNDFIYTVSETYQEYDLDGWHHWFTSKVLSYHTTQELAEQEIVNLIEERCKLNAHCPLAIESIKSNVEDFYDGAGINVDVSNELVYHVRIFRFKS